jgi:hypothetical protein
MTTPSQEALRALKATRDEMVRRGAPFDIGRFKRHFEVLNAIETRDIEQAVILELHETLKLLRQEIYPDSSRRAFAETMVYFTRMYDWGNDERLIDQTLAWGMEAWGFERVFKGAIRASMAQLAPDEYKILFGYKAEGREARAAEDARTMRLWRRIGIVITLLGIAMLAKRLSP